MFQKLSLKIIFFGLLFLIFPIIVQATEEEFNIDPVYDYLGRTKTDAFLYQLGTNAYFYVENEYYQNLDIEARKEFTQALQNLSQEFDDVIYPKLRESFGSEWKPGIDNDEKITVLISRIKEGGGGYFNSSDEYPLQQSPNSNQREMVYLNANYITTSLAKSFLAHEFLHLITFNQKEKIRNVAEEVWLNESRAEYVPTFLGYDNVYDGSNLQKRVNLFLQKPTDSLTEWKNLNYDYGALNLFTQYLVDHYGVKILTDSLKSEKVGISSLNEALRKNGYTEDFSQVFTNWTVAAVINNCNLGQKYCYLNSSLKNLKVVPQLNYLPAGGESNMTVSDYTKDWSGLWYKFIGGQGTLKFEFIGDQNLFFRVPYLLGDNLGNYSVNFLTLDSAQRGTIYFSEFGKKYASLIIIPSLQKKISGFDGIENYSKFLWTVSIISESQVVNEEEEKIQKLLSQIAFLQLEIARLQAQIAEILAKNGTSSGSCSKIENNLYYGLTNNQEVRCLQEFLKKQGQEIYPEGLVTGNFLSKTKEAVIRFQEKYASEILAPSGLLRGTGFVGPKTRLKINQLLGG